MSDQPEALAPSHQLPLPRLLVMMLVSQGLYAYVWFFQQWKFLQATYYQEPIAPLVRTLSLSMPVVDWVWSYKQFRLTAAVLARHAISFRWPVWLLTCCWMLGFYVNFLFFIEELPLWLGYGTLLTFLSLGLTSGAMCLIQSGLNQYWRHQESGTTPPSRPFSWGEKIAMLLGMLLLGSDLLEALHLIKLPF